MASKRNKRRKSCGNKIKHTKDGAFIANNNMRKMFGDFSMNVYKCGFCGYYHIGHYNRNIGKRRKVKRKF